MSAIAAIALGIAGLGLGLLGGRLIGRAVSRRQAVGGGLALVGAIAALMLSVSQSPAGWLFALVLAGYGVARAAASVSGAARGGVGTPLTPEQTDAFLARAEADEAIAALDSPRIHEGVVIRPDAQLEPSRREDRNPSAFDDDTPPSL